MNEFPLFTVLASMAKYIVPLLFVFIIICRLMSSKSYNFLIKLQFISKNKIFMRSFLAAGCMLGVIWAFMIGEVFSFRNLVLTSLAGIISGFIIIGLSYLIIYYLADYLVKKQDD